MARLPTKYQHRESVGETVRFDHEECGDSRGRLYVKRTSVGWVHHCHNCAPNMSGFTKMDGLPPPKDTIRAIEKLQENQVVRSDHVELPEDFTTDIPRRGLVWLYKYAITDEEIDRYGLGYSPSYDRLILPVVGDQGETIYWQGRNLGEVTKENPKYINVRAGGKDVFSKSDGILYTTNYCVLVEDILSTIKVGRCTPTIGLLGSYIPRSITHILGKFDKVYIWLDPDKQKEAIKYSIQLSTILGKIVKPILTDKDPKEYSTQEIKEILNV